MSNAPLSANWLAAFAPPLGTFPPTRDPLSWYTADEDTVVSYALAQQMVQDEGGAGPAGTGNLKVFGVAPETSRACPSYNVYPNARVPALERPLPLLDAGGPGY